MKIIEVILERYRIELSHFQEMGKNLQMVLLSFIFYLLASPLLGVFLSAFLWRQSGNIFFLALYYLGWSLALPLGFIVNGILLKKIHVKYLYFVGAVLPILGPVLAIFSQSLSSQLVLGYGLIFGFTAGIFWGNKNSLSFFLTKGKNRVYYNMLEFSLSLLSSVFMPMFMGWVLQFMDQSQLLSVEAGYKGMVFISLGLLIISGVFMLLASPDDIVKPEIFVKSPSSSWKQVRLFHLIYQLLFGVNLFYPTFLILYFGGKEGILGTLVSATSVLAAGTLYILARKVKMEKTVSAVIFANILYVIGILFFIWQFSWVGVLGYLALHTIANSIRWTMSYAVIMEVMDTQPGVAEGKTGYAYVFDNELFFNIGRSISILLFLGAIQVFSLEFAMKYVLLIFVFLQFLLVIPLKYLMKENAAKKTPANIQKDFGEK